MVNGAFALAEPLRVWRRPRPAGRLRPPTRASAVAFKQLIEANDAVAHGHVQQDADVHAEHHRAVGASAGAGCVERNPRPTPARVMICSDCARRVRHRGRRACGSSERKGHTHGWEKVRRHVAGSGGAAVRERLRRHMRRTSSGSSWSTAAPALIQALEGQGYDVGFVGEPTEAAVYLDSAQENAAARTRASRSARSSSTTRTSRPRRAEINAATEGEALAAEVATSGLSAVRQEPRARSTSRVTS